MENTEISMPNIEYLLTIRSHGEYRNFNAKHKLFDDHWVK